MEILFFTPIIIFIALYGALPAFIFFLFLLGDFIKCRKNNEPSVLKILFFD